MEEFLTARKANKVYSEALEQAAHRSGTSALPTGFLDLAEALSPALNSALTLLSAGRWTRDFSQGPFQSE